MTTITGSRRAGVAGCVAEIARYCGMGAGQGECRAIMVEACGFPGSSGVALGTIVVEVVIDMIGVLDRREFVLMATVAANRRARVAGCVTGNASHRNMRAGQNKSGRVVIKMRRFPRCRTVTLSAIVIEVVHDVIRILH